MTFRRFLFHLVFLFFSCNTLFSQTMKVTQDYGLWTGVKIKSKHNNFEFTLEPQVRTFYGFSKINNYIFDFSAEYNINKNFGIATQQRYDHAKKDIQILKTITFIVLILNITKDF